MLIVGYCYGIRSERRLCEEVELHLAYRWFCRLGLDDKVPDHSTFSVNRHGRFRESDLFGMCSRLCARMHGRALVNGEGFAVDASVMEANASRIAASHPRKRLVGAGAPDAAVAEFLGGARRRRSKRRSQAAEGDLAERPVSAWTAKANKRVQFGYGLNYLIDIENAVIVDVEATPARTYTSAAARR